MSHTFHEHNEIPSLPASTGPGSRVTVARDVSELPDELQRRYPTGWRRYLWWGLVRGLGLVLLFYAATGYDSDTGHWHLVFSDRPRLVNVFFFVLLSLILLFGAVCAWRCRTRPGAHFPWPLLLERPERQEFWRAVRHPRVGSTAVICDVQKRWVHSLAVRGRWGTEFLTVWVVLMVFLAVTDQLKIVLAGLPMLIQQVYLVWARPKAKKLAALLGVKFSEG